MSAVLTALALVVAAPVAARDIRVPRDFSSIQSALDAAGDGDEVVVSNGSYRESIVISRPVTLKSEHGRGSVAIMSAKDGENAVSVIGAAGVNVTGFVISAPGASAVLVRDSSNAAIVSNKLTGSVNGLLAERSRNLRVIENAATSNEKGIYFYFTDSSLIEKNSADSNVSNGILLHASHRNRMVGNTTNNNVWNGITLSSSNDNEIRDNRSVQNTYAIVISESTGNELSGNVERRRLFWLLPVALIYAAIMLYLVERKAFQLYYRFKYGERG
jgi:parallel beta-helix repeat protein